MTTDALHYELSDDLTLLSSSLRQLLAARGAQEASRQFWADDADFDRPLWRELAQLGFASMAAAEEPGGGAPYAQLELVSEELGRAAASVPFELHSLALLLLGAAANSEAFAPDLAEMSGGVAVLTAALDVPALPESPEPAPLEFAAGGVRGSCPLVLEGAVADAVIVPTTGGMMLVHAISDRRHVATLGMNRRADLSFSGVAAVRIEGDMQIMTRFARRNGALLHAARQAGMGDWLLRQTVDYAAERVQFGRPIGSFQAIQHKLAEAHIAISAGRHLVRLAANRIDAGADGFSEVERAKAFMATAMWQATVDAHQIHAGVGFILEHPLHLYFAQSRGAESAFGDARLHQRSAGAAILAGDGFRPNNLLGC